MNHNMGLRFRESLIRIRGHHNIARPLQQFTQGASCFLRINVNGADQLDPMRRFLVQKSACARQPYASQPILRYSDRIASIGDS